MSLSSEDRRVPGLWMNGCSTSGLFCVEALAEAGVGAENTCLFYHKIPGTEHPCGLSCEPVLLCFQLHQPGFYPPLAEPLARPELLLTQWVSSAGHL